MGGSERHPQLIKLAEANTAGPHLYKLMQDLKVIHRSKTKKNPYALRT
ncbi:MAG: hypothetical protein R2865_02055 [Deinococcales bacterium]